MKTFIELNYSFVNATDMTNRPEEQVKKEKKKKKKKGGMEVVGTKGNVHGSNVKRVTSYERKKLQEINDDRYVNDHHGI